MRILLLILIFFNCAYAKEETKFRPDYWTKGLHLNIGTGINISQFYSDVRFKHVGYGLNFKTDLGYFFTNRFALELSSNVKFNRVDEYLIWDSLFTIGARYRIKDYYVRGFYGRAPTVVFFNGHPPDEYKGTSASRLQFDGPVYGASFGKTFQHKETGIIWFLEGSGVYQRLVERKAIHMNGQVPEVVMREKDRSSIVGLYLMIGMMVF